MQPAASHPTPSTLQPHASPLPRQPAQVQVLHSIERPGLTPVFGTSVPPAGLSGQLRRLAYRFGEGDLRHWGLLMLADRVDVGEGLLSDLARGRIPNLFAEMGLGTEWRHNRLRFVARLALLAAAGAALAWWLRERRSRR